MNDLLLVLAVLTACAVIGYPACLLLPASTFKARELAAPPLGLGLFGVLATILYRLGLAPRMSLAVVGSAALLICAIRAVAFVRRPSGLGRSGRALVLCVAALLVVLLCLMPMWTGGAQFAAFQSNTPDQFIYLYESVAFKHYSYDFIASASGPMAVVGGFDPSVPFGPWLFVNRPTAALVYSAFSGLFHPSTGGGSYAFVAALQADMLFAAAFTLVNVFDCGLGKASFIAAALTLGFFEQYAIDINSWSELATLPLYVLLTATVVFAFDIARFGDGRLAAARLSGLFAILVASALYFYPEATAVYGVAGTGATAVGVLARRTREKAGRSIAALAWGMVAALFLCLAHSKATIALLIFQMRFSSVIKVPWWSYSQRYLLGREENYLAALHGDAGTTPLHFLYSAFSFPVEAGIAAIGLYFLLPTASWPIVAAVAWKLLLYAFLIALVVGAARSVARRWRENLGGPQSRMLGACVAASLVPVPILLMGQYWSAGKALSIAAPLLFIALVAPFLATGGMEWRWRIPATILVLGHLALGIIRPIEASDPSGIRYSGLPMESDLTARWSTFVRVGKSTLSWDLERWAPLLRQCRLVNIDVGNRPEDWYMERYIQFLLMDLGVPWFSRNPLFVDLDRGRPADQQLRSHADCTMTNRIKNIQPGQTVIWLGRDRVAAWGK